MQKCPLLSNSGCNPEEYKLEKEYFIGTTFSHLPSSQELNHFEQEVMFHSINELQKYPKIVNSQKYIDIVSGGSQECCNFHQTTGSRWP